MNNDSIIEATKKHVEKILGDDATGHDWWHVYRVWKIAKFIALKENANLLIVELAALLHDIADWKFNGGDENAGAKEAEIWLTQLNIENDIKTSVCEIIKTTSFKGANVASETKTLEAMIVQDADRLDAIGAIGIGRTFAYGGHKGRPMHTPNTKPTLHNSFDEYKKNQSSTINHFHEKLLLLKDRMNTETAKQLAQKKQDFMLKFLDEFQSEWDANY